MHHPVTDDIRLVGTLKRLHLRYFKRDDPHGWADYHCVEQANGRYWIHTHGPRRSKAPDLEFVDVPHDMRGHAHQLMFALIEYLRITGAVAAGGDIEGTFSVPGQTFRQMATLRPAGHGDKRHGNILRIVDWDRPMDSGFPARLFSAHVAAWAELADSPTQKEAMCRRSLAIFPGYFLEMAAGANFDPRKPEMTDLQQRANLSAYLSLADALFAQGRTAEAVGYLEEAIARCPGWGQTQRAYLVAKYRRKDDFMNFWREADIAEICSRRRPANTTGPLPKPKSRRVAKKKHASGNAKRSA